MKKIISIEALAKVVSKSRSHIANLLRIINLPEEVKKFILNGSISLGHARCLVGYANAVALAKRIIKDGLTVRYIEKFFEQCYPLKELDLLLTRSLMPQRVEHTFSTSQHTW